MQYRFMKSTNDHLSALGYGCMRFPEKNRKIDSKRAEAQLRSAIDQGVNYLDTAFMYHFGESEPFLGQALSGGLRQKVKLATKLTPLSIKTETDMEGMLNSQLKRLRTDRIDYYMLQAMDEILWNRLQKFDVLRFMDRIKADGRIVNAGFSFHGDPDTFREIVDAYDWQFCQIQYNYLDEFNQAGTQGLEYAAAKGLGVMIMEPLRGGSLGDNLPPSVAAIFKESGLPWSPAEWALRWVWNRPEVAVVLSGMNDESHIKENIRTACDALPNSLTEEQMQIIERVKAAYNAVINIGCTSCRYCMPCPSGVNIPMCFEIYNRRKFFNENKFECMAKYALMLGGLEKDSFKRGFASQCTECGKCETKCPQHLKIPELLKDVQGEFENFMLRMFLVYGKFFFARLRRRKG
jgi:predicted aldo/keto reductase-like oxidoreductase